MKYKGLKIGIIFFISSILLTLTFIGPVFIPIFAEMIGKSIDELFNIGNISGTTFYTCVTVCVLCFIAYILTLIWWRQNSITGLIIFFISIFIFLNAALFILTLDSRIRTLMESKPLIVLTNQLKLVYYI